MRPMVGVADAIRSAVVLEPSPTAEAAILALLGLSVDHGPLPSGESDGRPVRDPIPGRGGLPDTPEPSARPPSAPRPATTPAARPTAAGPPWTLPSTIERVVVGDRSEAVPSTADPLPAPRPGEESYRPQPDPLLPTARTADLLTVVAGVEEPTGAFDFAGMTDRMARGEPFVEMRALHTGRRHGVHLLVDVSAAMTPFAGDCAAVRKQIETMFGSGAVVRRFVGTPLRGAGTDARPWLAYRPPWPPTPVLLLTDLGLGPTDDPHERADVEEWLRFARVVGRAGVRVAALVPHPRHRVPGGLRRALHVVEWEDATTAATARRVVGRRPRL